MRCKKNYTDKSKKSQNKIVALEINLVWNPLDQNLLIVDFVYAGHFCHNNCDLWAWPLPKCCEPIESMTQQPLSTVVYSFHVGMVAPKLFLFWSLTPFTSHDELFKAQRVRSYQVCRLFYRAPYSHLNSSLHAPANNILNFTLKCVLPNILSPDPYELQLCNICQVNSGDIIMHQTWL